jgi:hypothetical protein
MKQSSQAQLRQSQQEQLQQLEQWRLQPQQQTTKLLQRCALVILMKCERDPPLPSAWKQQVPRSHLSPPPWPLPRSGVAPSMA